MTTTEECCICYEEKSKSEFYFGKCGHKICNNCKLRVEKCPICRLEYEKSLFPVSKPILSSSAPNATTNFFSYLDEEFNNNFRFVRRRNKKKKRRRGSRRMDNVEEPTIFVFSEDELNDSDIEDFESKQDNNSRNNSHRIINHDNRSSFSR